MINQENNIIINESLYLPQFEMAAENIVNIMSYNVNFLFWVLYISILGIFLNLIIENISFKIKDEIDDIYGLISMFVLILINLLLINLLHLSGIKIFEIIPFLSKFNKPIITSLILFSTQENLIERMSKVRGYIIKKIKKIIQ
tara:strand:- start:1531 stop:1959 length:429 start_codon:yes stop_codon:yes gene_type:complete